MPRYIAITDIHGEYDKLENVLSKIETREDDIFVFLGDYIDRGSKSKEVIERVIQQSETHKCVYLMGSHEYAYLHARGGDQYYDYLFWNYGGPATVKSYGSFENIYKIHGEFLDNLKFYYLTDNYLFVHAGINPRYSLEEQDETDLVYIRGAFYNHPHNLPQKVIFGHTEFDEPQVQKDKICIDLGCGKYKNAHLCALILDDGKEEFVYSD
ncbi:MAG: metallophosphoesterase [Candidatus Gastranaerophilales bacterium]|nr:metallophosphoesterase [Candidatus Gastranaerophilales bacterium]MCM1073679.1 metallophosphoesterase [Bacteroides sp.]